MHMNEEAAISPDPTPKVPRQPWRMFLAVLSFLLGLLSCFSCVFGVFFGMSAVALGALARMGLTRETWDLASGARWARRGSVLGGVGIGLALTWHVILMTTSGEHRGYHITCTSNLKQIGVCMKMYAGEHDGIQPDTLARMYPEYISDPTILLCPSYEKALGDLTRIDEWSDYAIVPGLHETGTPGDAKVLSCYEKVYTNHEPPARNELYLDGHVDFHRLGQPHQPSEPTRP